MLSADQDEHILTRTLLARIKLFDPASVLGLDAHKESLTLQAEPFGMILSYFS
jgi:hypothetical protein